MTIQTFQNLYAISLVEDLPEIERASRLVEIYTGLNPSQVDKMNLNRFDRTCRKITTAFDFSAGSPKKYIIIKGRVYMVDYSLSAGKYVDGASFSKDTINNLHKIMATIVTRVKWGRKIEMSHEAKSEDMLKADFRDCYHTAVFFWAVLTRSIKGMEDYLVTQAVTKGMEKTQATQQMKDLQKALDGFTQPRWLQRLRISL